MRERDFQRKVQQIAELRGWKIMHIGESTKRVRRGRGYVTVPDKDCIGWPDLTMVHEATGTVLFRELKTVQGVVTEQQEEWLRVLHKVGMDTGVWRPADWDIIIETLDNPGGSK